MLMSPTASPLGSATRPPGFHSDLPFTNCGMTLVKLPISLCLSFQICSMGIKRKRMYMLVCFSHQLNTM